MNKVVREHYPAAKLPDDLRGTLDLGARVKVTIVEETSRATARAQAIADLIAHREMLRPSANDAVERVRALRDEWDR